MERYEWGRVFDHCRWKNKYFGRSNYHGWQRRMRQASTGKHHIKFCLYRTWHCSTIKESGEKHKFLSHDLTTESCKEKGWGSICRHNLSTKVCDATFMQLLPLIIRVQTRWLMVYRVWKINSHWRVSSWVSVMFKACRMTWHSPSSRSIISSSVSTFINCLFVNSLLNL